MIHLKTRDNGNIRDERAEPVPFLSRFGAHRLCLSLGFAMFCVGQHCCPNCWPAMREPPLSGAAARQVCRRDEGASDGGKKQAAIGQHVAEDMRHKGCLLD
jgi:hypothetical protein